MNTNLFRGRGPLNVYPTLNLTAAGVALIAVCYGLARFGYGFFTPVFRAEFALSPATMGLFASASYMAYCVAIAAATALTATLGARRLVIASGIMATCSMAGIAVAPTAGILGIAVAATGLCTGLVSPPLATVIAEHVAQKYQSRVQTMVNSGAGIGVAISVPVALVAASQWRLAWLIFAILATGTTFWIARSMPRHTRRASSLPQADRRAILRHMLALPEFPDRSVRLLIASCLLGASSTAMLTFGRDLMVSAGAQSNGTSTTAWALLGVCGLMGAGAGNLISRFGLHACWIAGCLGMAAATLLLAISPDNPVIAVGSMALFGAAYTTASGFLLIWTTEVYSHSPAMGVGTAFLVIALGQAAATPTLGLLMEQSTAAAPFYAAALAATIACVITPRVPAQPTTGLIEVIPTPDIH